RTGTLVGAGTVARKAVHKCADGYVTFVLAGAAFADTSRELVRWMDDRGAAPEWLKNIDFSTWTLERFATASDPEFLQLVKASEEAVEQFLEGISRHEIYRFALDRHVMIAPVATIEDVASDEQLADREFFHSVHFPALDRELTLPGPFARFSSSPMTGPTPAPRLGEHTADILRELGVENEALQYLFGRGVI